MSGLHFLDYKYSGYNNYDLRISHKKAYETYINDLKKACAGKKPTLEEVRHKCRMDLARFERLRKAKPDNKVLKKNVEGLRATIRELDKKIEREDRFWSDLNGIIGKVLDEAYLNPNIDKSAVERLRITLKVEHMKVIQRAKNL